MATMMEPKLLKFRIYDCQYKNNYHLELNTMVPFLDDLVLVMVLKMLESCLSIIFGFTFLIFFNLL